MPTFEDALCLLVIFLAYGIAGHMDYEDAVLLDETQQNLRHSASTDCWSATPSPTGNSAAQVSQLGTEPSTTTWQIPLLTLRQKQLRFARPSLTEESTMQTHVAIPCNDTPLLNVRAPEDIEFLVKESEVLTGKPGRTFVIAGADRLSYRVQWHPMGSKVERLDAHGQALSSQHLLPWEFLDHSVVEALRAGQLFTPLVRRPG